MSGEPWVVITSGGTREPIDEVRYIGNVSTGRTGSAVARALVGRGLGVVLVHAIDAVRPEPTDRLETRSFVTGGDLAHDLTELARRRPAPLAVVHAAAVGDWAPSPRAGKIASGSGRLELWLEPTPKLAARLPSLFPESLIIQFKLEVGLSRDELRRRALASARANGADLVVANDLHDIAPERHRAVVLDTRGGQVEVRDHDELAQVLLDRILGGD